MTRPVLKQCKQNQRIQAFLKVYPGLWPGQWNIHHTARTLSTLHDALNLLRGRPLCHGVGNDHLFAVQKQAESLKNAEKT
jgi:hypothetical protein